MIIYQIWNFLEINNCFIGEIFEPFTKLKKLEHISFQYDLLDESLMLWILSLNKLKYLNLSYSTWYSTRNYNFRNLTELEELNLSNVAELFDEYGEELNLSNAYKYAEDLKLPLSLKNLNLSHHNYITDIHIKAISKLINLTNLNLSNCPQLTDVTFKYIECLTNLEHLNISECPKFTLKSLEYLQTKLPNIFIQHSL